MHCKHQTNLGQAEPAVLSIQIPVNGAPPSGACGNWSDFQFLGLKVEEPQGELGGGYPSPGLWLRTPGGQDKEEEGGAEGSAGVNSTLALVWPWP